MTRTEAPVGGGRGPSKRRRGPIGRWRATVFYRTMQGTVDVEHFLKELGDLHDRIEDGPHFDTVERIVIERINHTENPKLTVEEAEKR